MRARPRWIWFLPFVLCSLPAGAGAPIVWNMGGVAPEGSPLADWALRVARNMERNSGGLVKVRARLGGVLGDELEMLAHMRSGRLQAFGASIGAFESVLPALSVLETPYLFDDEAALDRASRSDPFALPEMTRMFRAQGLEPWGLCFAGWRAISTRTRVRGPADLRGLRMRAQPSRVHEALWKTLGTKVSSVSLAAVQAGFQEGRFDGIDVPLLWLFGTSAAEHVRFHLRTGHMAQGAAMVVGKDALAALPRAVRDRIMADGKRFMAEFNRTSRELETQLLGELRARGVEVAVPTAAELATWKAAMAAVRPMALEAGGAEGRALLAALERPRAR